jgi:pyruvate/2-oxoglutarate dehydrogenase complex dihydrolipoamide acyltransferase (E2) component
MGQGAEHTDEKRAGKAGGFNLGKMWIGRHTADQDVLVFDPEVSDANAANLSFYSLSQFRTRSFPRAVAEQKIAEITEKKARAEAQAQYEQRTARKAAHDSEQSVAREGRTGRHREHAVEAHRRFVTNLGIDYAGVKDTTGQEIRPRRSRCASCGIAVDNFVGAACLACNDLICSCGACNCGTKTRTRARPKTTLSKGDQ